MSTDLVKIKYEFGETIGRGQFGKIKKCKNKNTNETVAIKIIKKDKVESQELLLREVNIMKLCKHPHIVKCYDFMETEKYYYIVMEYIPYGDLFDFLEKYEITSKQCKIIIAQIISAIEYCHGNLIAHRDLKLENILVADIKNFRIKIADFGLASYIDIGKAHGTHCGTLEYVAPEVISKKSYNAIKADIWSIGVILFCILESKFPWKSDNIVADIVNFNYHKLSKDLKAQTLIDKIFVPEETRNNISEIKKDAWIAEYIIPSYLPVREPINNINLLYVDKISSLGYKIPDILLSLYENLNTQETAIYHLLDERFTKEKKSGTLKKLDKSSISKSDSELYVGVIKKKIKRQTSLDILNIF